MDDMFRHTSAFPELHRLYQTPIPSQILGSSISAQNLLNDPALFVRMNIYQTSLESPSSSVNTPKRKPFSVENPGATRILRGTSEAFSTLAVAPIERVYMLMQCQNEMLKHGHLSSPYKGMKDCLLRTVKHEGVLSLWRGSSVNVITPLTMQAFIHAIAQLRGDPSKEVKRPPLWLLTFSGMLGLPLRYPFHYIRTRLANDVKAVRQSHISLDSSANNFSNSVGNWKFNGIFDVCKKTLQLEGIGGLYRGFTSACAGAFAYQALSVINIQYKKTQTEDKQTYSSKLASIVLWGVPLALFYPFLTISHRMMMTSGEVTKYKGAMDAVRQIVKYEGVSSLYKGMPAYMMYNAARNAALIAYIFLVYSGYKKLTSVDSE